LLRFFVGDDVETKTYESEELALRDKRKFYRALEQEDRTVSAAVEQYLSYMAKDKEDKSSSIETTQFRFDAFLGDVMHEPVAGITASRAKQLYKKYRETPTRTKRPPAAATHQNTLKQVRTLFGWCVKKKWVRSNPFAAVELVGKPNKGKKKLRIDETRKLFDQCLAEGSEMSDAVAITLMMGFRACETLGLKCRDVDDDGRVLWVDDDDDVGESHLKTSNSRRCVEVPEVLRPILLRRKDAGERGHLFVGRTKDWLIYHVRRLCALAKVPEVSTQGLRATHSELGHEAGASASVVAASLGHTVRVNQQHYTSREAARTQSRQRVLDRIMGESR